MRKMLHRVFENKYWYGSKEGWSGKGSSMEATTRLRAALPDVLQRYNVSTFFDGACGDWVWMRSVDLSGIEYIGADISLRTIRHHQMRYAHPNRRFIHADITSDTLPDADLMLCRDCLFHLKHKFRWFFFENFVRSNIPFLMMTMHHLETNRQLTSNGNFAAFSPLAEPFLFPEPREMIHETMDELPEDLRAYDDVERRSFRSLGIWSKAAIAAALADAKQRGIAPE